MFNKIKMVILMLKIKFWYSVAIEKLKKDPQYNEKLSEVKKKLGFDNILEREKPYWGNLKCRVWVGYLKPIEFLIFASMFETKLLEAPMQTICIKLDDFDEKDNYYIIIPESLKSGYSEKYYLDFIIGHELGHIKSGYYENIKRKKELEEDMKADEFAWEYCCKNNNESSLPIAFIFRNTISNWILDLQSEIPEVKKLMCKTNLLDVFFRNNFKIQKRVHHLVYKCIISKD